MWQLSLCLLLISVGAQSADTTFKDDLEYCSPQDIDIIQKQLYNFWSSADAASVRIFIGEEHLRRVREHSEGARRVCDFVFPSDQSEAVHRSSVIRLLYMISNSVAVMHRHDVLVEDIRHAVKPTTFVPGMTSDIYKVFFEMFMQLMSDVVSCLDQVAWNTCYNSIMNISLREYNAALESRQAK